MLLQRSGVAARASGEPLTWSHVDTQGSRSLPGSKLIVPGAEAHTTSHEPVRSEDELRRTAFGVGNRRVCEVFKAGLVNTLNRQRSEEPRPLAVTPLGVFENSAISGRDKRLQQGRVKTRIR